MTNKIRKGVVKRIKRIGIASYTLNDSLTLYLKNGEIRCFKEPEKKFVDEVKGLCL